MYATLRDEEIAGQLVKVVKGLSEVESDNAVACGASVKVGDVYHGGGFLARRAVETPRYTPALSEIMLSKIQELEDAASQLRVQVAGTADGTKLAVYKEKYEIASKWLTDRQNTPETAAMALEANNRGETLETLMLLVKGLGDRWRTAGLAIDAAYQRHKQNILACSSEAEVEQYNTQVNWPELK